MITRLHLNQNGLAMFLGGELQTAVYLEFLDHPGTLREIHTRMQHTYRQGVAYTTIASVANKLCKKGILKRAKLGTARDYTYTAVIDEDALIEYCIARIVKHLHSEYDMQLADAYAGVKTQ